MATDTTSSSVVRLRWDMKDGLVVVTPQDEDRFSIKVGRAIEILQQANRADEFKQQFKILLRVLAEWLKDQVDVGRAYLTHRDGALAFVVIRKSREYDDEFEDSLSNLDYEIANDADLNLIKIDGIALPSVSDTAASSFLDPEFTLEYVGHGKRSGSYSAGQ